jgi:hypothetical protein
MSICRRLRRRGPGQFQGMLRDRGVGGFGFALTCTVGKANLMAFL